MEALASHSLGNISIIKGEKGEYVQTDVGRLAGFKIIK